MTCHDTMSFLGMTPSHVFTMTLDTMTCDDTMSCIDTFRGVTPGGCGGGACTPPASLPNKFYRIFTQLLPNFTQLLPNFYPTYPTFTQLLPNFTQLLPNLPNCYPTFTQLYPTFTQLYPTFNQIYLPQNFFRAFGAKRLPNSKIFTQLHPPWKSELLRPW